MGNVGLFMVVLFCAALAASVPRASAVYASYHLYNPSSINWDLNAASAYCSTWDGSQSESWRSEYPWTAYCIGDADPSNCGRCLRVTNTATGASVTVRIVDHCANGGLDLDQTPFQQLDTNEAGYAAGHLDVDIAFTGC